MHADYLSCEILLAPNINMHFLGFMDFKRFQNSIIIASYIQDLKTVDDP